MKPALHITCWIIALSLAGCGTTYFVPMAVAPSKIDTQPLGAEPMGSPQIHVMTHADGFGWQVSASQDWIENEQRTEQEYWKGLTYRKADTLTAQVGYTASTTITCPGSLMAHVMLRMIHVMGVFDRAEPTWQLIKQICIAPLLGLDPTSGMDDTQPGPALSTTRIQRHLRRPLTSGRLQIRWTHPRWDPVGAEYPLTTTPIDIRIRELAPILLRTHSAEILQEGHMELALFTTDNHTIRHPLSIGVSTLTAALRDDLVRKPQQHWPTTMRFRIETAHPQLATLAQTVLTELHAPIVTRGSNSTTLQAVQRQEVSPMFDESHPSSIGHWTGANILLGITTTALTPNTQLVVVLASDIESGQVLGQFTIECARLTDATCTSALRSQLRSLISTDTNSGRRGTLIEEHP